MLKQGTVDGAVVIGCSLLLNPVLSVMLQKMNTVSLEAKSKPFDASGTVNFVFYPVRSFGKSSGPDLDIFWSLGKIKMVAFSLIDH
jgi:hypothetical protein